jgi:hypothetical protein
MPFEAAAQMEKDLTEDLRAHGYTVTGGTLGCLREAPQRLQVRCFQNLDFVAFAQQAAGRNASANPSTLAQRARHSFLGKALDVATRRARTLVFEEHLANAKALARKVSQRDPSRDDVPSMLTVVGVDAVNRPD